MGIQSKEFLYNSRVLRIKICELLETGSVFDMYIQKDRSRTQRSEENTKALLRSGLAQGKWAL